MKTAFPKEAAPKDAAPQNAAAKTLRTIDDPFFDDPDAFGLPLDRGSGAGVRSPLVGGGLGSLPPSGPSSPSIHGSPIRLGPGIHPQGGQVRPSAEGIGQDLHQDRISAKSATAARLREAQNAALARQRCLNTIIGAGTLAIAIVGLFTLAALVFSGPREKDGNATTSSTFESEEANMTEDSDDIDVGHGFLLKREITHEGYQYENYAATALKEAERDEVSWKGEADSAITTVEANSTVSWLATSTEGNGQHSDTRAKRARTRPPTSIWENSQNKSTHRYKEKLFKTRERAQVSFQG